MAQRTSTSTHTQSRRGVISTEYMLILACIVIPIALWTPTLLHMTGQYCHRIVSVVAMPFGISF
jgi:hypothetical protein